MNYYILDTQTIPDVNHRLFTDEIVIGGDTFCYWKILNLRTNEVIIDDSSMIVLKLKQAVDDNGDLQKINADLMGKNATNQVIMSKIMSDNAQNKMMISKIMSENAQNKIKGGN